MTNEEKFLTELKNAFNKIVEDRQQKLLEDDLDEGKEGKYYEYEDRDYVHNGVGYECCRCDVIQDEASAWDDAEDEILEELKNNEDAVYDLFDNKEFNQALITYLRG